MITQELVLPQAHQAARDQGQRPTCIAFALSEVELISTPGQLALSPEHLYQSAAIRTPGWNPGDGIPLGAALTAATGGLPLERDFPYQPDEPSLPLSPVPTSLRVYGIPVFHIPIDLDQIIQQLRSGLPVGIGLRLTESFFQPVQGVVDFETFALPNTLHAVAAVGLGWDGGTAFLLARNSWGDGWGISGNAWLSAKYVQAHGVCAMRV